MTRFCTLVLPCFYLVSQTLLGCSVDASRTTAAAGGGGDGLGGTSAQGGASARAGAPATVCEAQASACSDCRSGQCSQEDLDCLNDVKCASAIQTSDGCIAATCSFATCNAGLSANTGTGMALAACMTTHCAQRCAPVADGGGGDTSGAGSAGGTAATGGTPPSGGSPAGGSGGMAAACKGESDACTSCLAVSCDVSLSACDNDDVCSESEALLVDCWDQNGCAASCLTTFSGAGAAAKVLGDCISTNCSADCL